jgi:hypothetical protein
MRCSKSRTTHFSTILQFKVEFITQMHLREVDSHSTTPVGQPEKTGGGWTEKMGKSIGTKGSSRRLTPMLP